MSKPTIGGHVLEPEDIELLCNADATWYAPLLSIRRHLAVIR